jgi:hypothetical protein
MDHTRNTQRNKTRKKNKKPGESPDKARTDASRRKASRTGKFVIPPEDEYALFQHICEQLDSTIAMRLWYLIESREWHRVPDLELPPNPSRDDILAANLLKKYPFEHPLLTPLETAIKAFLAAEEVCKNTNEKIKNRWDHSWTLQWSIVKDIIAKILGPLPVSPQGPPGIQGTLRLFLDKGHVGANATVGNHGLSANAICNLAKLSFYDPCLEDGDLLGSPLLCGLYDLVGVRSATIHKVAGSKISFVPKTAKTHRSIAIEPGVNLWYQLGAGVVISDRLKTVGIDITDQSRNQKLALSWDPRIASCEYATIDLSAASDTISYNLVKWLLPKDWFQVLSLLRTPQGFIKETGTTVIFEKFSSMGNGFTFPLETLIFFAIAKSVAIKHGCGQRVLAYGDDIIVPRKIFSEVTYVLGEVGFEVNSKKSFATGSYRESCGVYSVDGRSVRPFRIQAALSGAADLYKLHNSVMAQAIAEGSGHYCSSRWRSTIRAIIRLLPKELRLSGPLLVNDVPGSWVRVTDTHLYDLLYEPSIKWKQSGMQTLEYKVLAPKALYQKIPLHEHTDVARYLLYKLVDTPSELHPTTGSRANIRKRACESIAARTKTADQSRWFEKPLKGAGPLRVCTVQTHTDNVFHPVYGWL